MKYTICLTQQCNLACAYCYIGKRPAEMSPGVGKRIVDFIFARTPLEEHINIGFFGGEPLLNFETLQFLTNTIENHPSYTAERVQLAVVTNGTILSNTIVNYLNVHGITFCTSCDGPPQVQDTFRRFPDGRGSSAIVEQTIRQAVKVFPVVLVNAVYHPATFRSLPNTVEYLASLGVTQIYLNADYSAPWSKADAELLPSVYEQVGKLYVENYLGGHPLFISLVDGKIAVILRGGYRANERCQMGRAEMAFAPDGGIYPCERLIGNGCGQHHIGHLEVGSEYFVPASMLGRACRTLNECKACGLAEYCMNWCGCSNYFSTQDYDKPGPFLCASERASIQVAFTVYQELERRVGPAFADHLAGLPFMNSIWRADAGGRTC